MFFIECSMRSTVTPIHTCDLPCKGGKTHLSMSDSAHTDIPVCRYLHVFARTDVFVCLYINRIVVHLHHFFFKERKCGLSPRKAASVLRDPGACCPHFRSSQQSFITQDPSPSHLSRETVQAHFQIRTLTDTKIFTLAFGSFIIQLLLK